jgi:hypothetical protein
LTGGLSHNDMRNHSLQPVTRAANIACMSTVLTPKRPTAAVDSRIASPLPLRSQDAYGIDARLAALPYVQTTLNYLVPSEERPYRYTYDVHPGIAQDNQVFERRPARVHDARSLAHAVTLDVEGFALAQHRSAVRDFYDDLEVRTVYYAEAERLLQQLTGAHRVVVFDHVVRRRAADRPSLDSGRVAAGLRGPVGRVHNDFTDGSGPTRLKRELGAESDALAAGRFSVINVWRPIRGPLLDAPLAACDARTVAPDDLIASDLIYRDRVGEVYQVRWSERHRWFYFSALREDEALLLKCYDSALDGTARFAPHTAFEDPATPADASPRESIELRAFVFYPH